MTKHEILETYGKSVYQIELEIAIALWLKEDRHDETQGRSALTEAKSFTQALLSVSPEEAK